MPIRNDDPPLAEFRDKGSGAVIKRYRLRTVVARLRFVAPDDFRDGGVPRLHAERVATQRVEPSRRRSLRAVGGTFGGLRRERRTLSERGRRRSAERRRDG